MPSFLIWPFFLAGAACALGPVIIHLLNRRRFRVVHWAAMDFLRQALQRNRRILQLRDLILLVLRTAAVFLFGVALAQPSCRVSDDASLRNQPVHAVLLVDNSLSMGYESLQGTILDAAKKRGAELIDALPASSRISVIPLCGSREGYSVEPYASREAARAALDQIAPVDRAVRLAEVVSQAQAACEAGPKMGRRLIFLTDQQSLVYEGQSNLDLAALPAPLQIVNVAPDTVRENTSVASLRLQDGVADTQSPATILTEVRHEGSRAAANCEIKLIVGGETVAAQTRTIDSGATVEVVFKHQFTAPAIAPGQPAFVPVEVSVSGGEGASDYLPADNSRFLMAPILQGVPIVFVDQFAGSENPRQGKIGETRLLRRQLAPVVRGEDPEKQLIKVRYVAAEKLLGEDGRKILADARLVVVAGISDPTDVVENLRQYVEQGGQLLIAAGGQFDPAQWTAAAWKDGRGILPVPLDKEPVGKVPGERDKNVEFFRLAYGKSMQNRALFNLAGEPASFLEEIYSQPVFFKCIKALATPEAAESLRKVERTRLGEQYARRAEVRLAIEKLRTQQRTSGKLTAGEDADLARLQTELKNFDPDWLIWHGPQSQHPLDTLSADEKERAAQLDELADRGRFSVVARFDRPDGLPFLVQRPIGRGLVTLCTSGLYPEWNTLAPTNASILLDRLARLAVESTLPQRNFAVADRLPLPLAAGERGDRFTLVRPGQSPEQATSIDLTNIGREQRGAIVEQPFSRGVYRIVRVPGGEAKPQSAESVAPVVVEFAVNGEARESELAELPMAGAEKIASADKLRWLGARDAISLEGDVVRGQFTWWWIVLVVLGLLLLEIAILAWPVWQARQAAATAPSASAAGSPSSTATRPAPRETVSI